MKLKKTFFALLLSSLLLPAGGAAQRLNPKLKSKDHAIRRVVVLPRPATS